MATDLTIPDPGLILDYLEAFRRSKVMFAGVSLGIFDALSNQPQTAAELALLLHCDASSLERILQACVGLQLLETDQGNFRNTLTAETYLTSSSPRRMTGYIHYSNRVMWNMWGNLEDAVREGTHRWHQTYGWDGPIFDSHFKTDEQKREFLMGMHGFGIISSPIVVSAIDLSRFHKIVDLGGATGHLLIAACHRYPPMQAVLFDLPKALPLAREIIGESGVADRIEIIGGDFFTDPLPKGDLYALGRILHDWSDDKVKVLIAKIFDTLPCGGGILIAEKILLEEKNGPRWAQMQDLNMLVVTEGRERSLSEYESLLREAGFSNIVGCRTNAPLDAVLAIKK